MRYRTNDYSVPVAYGHREVWIRGYVHEVVIGCGGGIIARHPRSYERDDMVFDPIHYLPLLEQKIAALDQAAPLAGWELPGAFPALRRLLEARMGKSGKREYVQVLRLLETFDLEALHGAVKDALRLGAIGYDAVKHLVLCRIERRPPKLDLDAYPSLPRANVATTATASYMSHDEAGEKARPYRAEREFLLPSGIVGLEQRSHFGKTRPEVDHPVDNNPITLVHDVNGRIQTLLTRHGKEDFQSEVSLKLPNTLENHRKY